MELLLGDEGRDQCRLDPGGPAAEAGALAFSAAIGRKLGGEDWHIWTISSVLGEGDLEQDKGKALKAHRRCQSFCQPETVAEAAWGSGDTHIQSIALAALRG